MAKDVRELIRTMWQTNLTWGAPRIMDELRKLGISVPYKKSEKSVAGIIITNGERHEQVPPKPHVFSCSEFSGLTGAGEPYAQEAHVTDAAMVRLMSNPRHPISIDTPTMARRCGSKAGGNGILPSHPATERVTSGEREPTRPYIQLG
jgi:hypothetical protein